MVEEHLLTEKSWQHSFTALKRPIDADTTEKVEVSRISRELEEIGQSEIQSSVIGKSNGHFKRIRQGRLY